VMYKLARHIHAPFEDKDYGRMSSDEEIGRYLGIALCVLVSIITTLIATFELLPSAIENLVNPGWTAIERILDSVRGK